VKTGTRNILLALGTIVLAAALFVVLSPGSDDQPVSAGVQEPAPTQSAPPQKAQKPAAAAVPTILVRSGQPVGGVLKIDANEGDRIQFKVDSDVAAEIHVHGFDISKEVEAGETVKLSFDADFTGIFEAELEETAVPIAEIQVNP
jgi:hypothetical protein